MCHTYKGTPSHQPTEAERLWSGTRRIQQYRLRQHYSLVLRALTVGPTYIVGKVHRWLHGIPILDTGLFASSPGPLTSAECVKHVLGTYSLSIRHPSQRWRPSLRTYSFATILPMASPQRGPVVVDLASSPGEGDSLAVTPGYVVQSLVGGDVAMQKSVPGPPVRPQNCCVAHRSISFQFVRMAPGDV